MNKYASFKELQFKQKIEIFELENIQQQERVRMLSNLKNTNKKHRLEKLNLKLKQQQELTNNFMLRSRTINVQSKKRSISPELPDLNWDTFDSDKSDNVHTPPPSSSTEANLSKHSNIGKTLIFDSSLSPISQNSSNIPANFKLQSHSFNSTGSSITIFKKITILDSLSLLNIRLS